LAARLTLFERPRSCPAWFLFVTTVLSPAQIILAASRIRLIPDGLVIWAWFPVVMCGRILEKMQVLLKTQKPRKYKTALRLLPILARRGYAVVFTGRVLWKLVFFILWTFRLIYSNIFLIY
jgi:hypothetical protein